MSNITILSDFTVPLAMCLRWICFKADRKKYSRKDNKISMREESSEKQKESWKQCGGFLDF
jgi:hypothetical protein